MYTEVVYLLILSCCLLSNFFNSSLHFLKMFFNWSSIMGQALWSIVRALDTEIKRYRSCPSEFPSRRRMARRQWQPSVRSTLMHMLSRCQGCLEVGMPKSAWRRGVWGQRGVKSSYPEAMLRSCVCWRGGVRVMVGKGGHQLGGLRAQQAITLRVPGSISES